MALANLRYINALNNNNNIEPIAVENLGVFSSTTLNFISELGRRICVHTGDARETSYLFQRISITLQRWWRGSVVERRSLAGELSLSCARPAADG